MTVVLLILVLLTLVLGPSDLLDFAFHVPQVSSAPEFACD